ncbi:MAG: FHA domain-containing protein [Lachnospiraceae bacterium]|nr:FHA domain-containing protein [Lachnospiraceae bacterium]MCD7765204.1 FHA domain-containing protein [Lachnospiraceae bacterium]
MEGSKRSTVGKCYPILLGLLLCVFFAVIGAKPVHAAPEINEDGIGIVFGCDSSGNVVAISPGIVVSSGTESYIFAGYDSSFNDISYVTYMSMNQNITGDFSDVYVLEELGLLMIYTYGNYGGYTEEDAAWLSELYKQETVYCVGLDYGTASDTLAGYMTTIQSEIADAGEVGGFTVVVLEDTLGASKQILSGGGIFTENGELCGILCGVTDDSGYSVFLPSDSLLNSGGESEAGGSGESTYETESMSEASGTSGTDSTSGTGSTGSTSGTETIYLPYSSPINQPLFLSLFFGALAVLIISTVMYFRGEIRRKERQEPEFPEFEKEGAVSGNQGLRLMGVGGYFGGKTLEVGEKALVFGRNASRCNMVYPDGTKGVSGLHCKVEKKDGRLYVTDLGSTYGTFMQNGFRLTSNIPQELKSGDAFYLADMANTFEVR